MPWFIKLKKLEDCKGNGFRCSLFLLAASPVFFTRCINTLVLSFSLAISKHSSAQSYCEATILRLLLFYTSSGQLKFACHKFRPTRDEMRDQQITPPRTLMLPFFFFFFLYFRHSRSKTRSCLFWRPFASFFFLVLLWKEFILHSFVVTFHFSHLSSSPPVFLSSWGWWLDLHKCRLFCLHIQHTTHCLFEWQTLVSWLEAAVCGFYLSISLQICCEY